MSKVMVAVVAACLAGPACADILKCTMQLGGNRNGAIAPDIYLIDDAPSGKVLVMDDVIAYFNKDKPVEAKVAKDDAAKRVMDWTVLMVNSAGQRTKMGYHATLFRADSRLEVLARPNGFDNTFSAQGRCAPYQG